MGTNTKSFHLSKRTLLKLLIGRSACLQLFKERNQKFINLISKRGYFVELFMPATLSSTEKLDKEVRDLLNQSILPGVVSIQRVLSPISSYRSVSIIEGCLYLLAYKIKEDGN